MVRVVTMLHGEVTGDTEVIVVTHGASDELRLVEDWAERLASYPERLNVKHLTLNALIASTAQVSSHWDVFSLDVRGEGTRDFFLLFRLLSLDHFLRGNSLGLAVDNLAVFDGSLDEPMLLVVAEISTLDAILAEIKVAIIADTAVPVCVRNSAIAIVTANCEIGTWLWP